MNWSHDNARGLVFLDGQIVAFTSPQGWRASLTSGHGDLPIKAVRTVIFRLPNDALAEDIRRSAVEELESISS